MCWEAENCQAGALTNKVTAWHCSRGASYLGREQVPRIPVEALEDFNAIEPFLLEERQLLVASAFAHRWGDGGSRGLAFIGKRHTRWRIRNVHAQLREGAQRISQLTFQRGDSRLQRGLTIARRRAAGRARNVVRGVDVLMTVLHDAALVAQKPKQNQAAKNHNSDGSGIHGHFDFSKTCNRRDNALFEIAVAHFKLLKRSQ
jgi:hypothetical protein